MSTFAELLIAVAFVLPGFIVVDLAETRRARPERRTDPELILRALTYALLIQGAVALTGWTGQLVSDTDTGHHWSGHVSAIVLFVLVVIVVVPTLLGLGLNALLRSAEQRGNLSPLMYALGGRDVRQGWDYIFERYGYGYVFLTLSPGVAGRPNFYIAKFSNSSWAPQQSSEQRDVYFEEIWIADSTGQITGEFAEPRGLWVSLDRVDMLQFISPPAATQARAGLWRWLGGT